MEIFLRINRMEALNNSAKAKPFGFNMLIYIITIVVVMIFIYFIYQFLYGPRAFVTNLINEGKMLDAKNPSSAIFNKAIPNIYEGGKYSINFWIYINKFDTGTRKHLIEIGPNDMTDNTNFSTILIALGATTPTLLVRVDTVGNGSAIDISGHNYGIIDCSGSSEDCSNNNTLTKGSYKGFSKITDTNIVNRMKDNSLNLNIMNDFFKPFTSIDENSIMNSSATCDYKEIEMQTYVNICVILSGRTLDIYKDGKLVKTCVYNHFFKVDPTGVTLRSLQTHGEFRGFDGEIGRIQVFNTQLTPDEIYKNYTAGQNGSASSNDPLAFIKYIFTGTA